MTSARNAGRALAYASSVNRLSRVMAIFSSSIVMVAGNRPFLVLCLVLFLFFFWVLPPYPFEHHGGILFFLVAIMLKNGFQFRIGACVDALVVPVYRLEFFHQRGDRTMHVHCFRRQFVERFVIAFICHIAILLNAVCFP